MRERFLVLFHWFRLGINWNKIISINTGDGLIHEELLVRNQQYATACHKYNESKQWLVNMGLYIPARP